MELLYPHPPPTPGRGGRDAPIVSHLKIKWVVYFFFQKSSQVFFALGCALLCTTQTESSYNISRRKNFNNS